VNARHVVNRQRADGRGILAHQVLEAVLHADYVEALVNRFDGGR